MLKLYACRRDLGLACVSGLTVSRMQTQTTAGGPEAGRMTARNRSEMLS
jgi:hypothetical protein